MRIVRTTPVDTNYVSPLHEDLVLAHLKEDKDNAEDFNYLSVLIESAIQQAEIIIGTKLRLYNYDIFLNAYELGSKLYLKFPRANTTLAVRADDTSDYTAIPSTQYNVLYKSNGLLVRRTSQSANIEFDYTDYEPFKLTTVAGIDLNSGEHALLIMALLAHIAHLYRYRGDFLGNTNSATFNKGALPTICTTTYLSYAGAVK
jgi:hypothetical protein